MKKELKKREIPLDLLQEGDYFEIVGLENTFKDLCVKRTTDCSILVEGNKLEDGTWIPLKSYNISLKTPVIRLDKERKVFTKKGSE